jgi:hypothetical protein
MFSLIITIISIALVAALAVATIYYGGSAFTQGTAKAQASAFVAAGQQVSGALTLFANENGNNRGTLVTYNLTTAPLGILPSYLAAVPTVAGIPLTVTANTVQAVGVPTSVCDAINTSANLTGTNIPATAALAASAAAPFSCAADKTFVFKG